MSFRFWLGVLPLLLVSGASEAGVFHLTSTSLYDPFVVSHPPGYTGAGGPITVDICLGPDSELLRGPLQAAIATWNALDPIQQNCQGCRLWEEPPGESEPRDLESVLLHELGHCAMGLGHPNLDLAGSPTSFTASRDVTIVNAGADGVRGSKDDQVGPLPGTRVIHWFRKADNDPLLIDSATVDSTTYSRRISDLPAGSLWQANGNRAVGVLLGQPSTQAVMYSGYSPGQKFSGITADEWSTVRYGMTGVDELANTADDYSVTLQLIADCGVANIQVRYRAAVEPDELGVCLASLALISGSHRRLVPFLPEVIIRIDINSALQWNAIFASGFETGSTSEWDGN